MQTGSSTPMNRRFRLGLLPRIIIAIISGIALGYVVPDFVICIFNTFNGLFDQLLKFLIPLIILGLVTPAIADVGRNAGRMLYITALIAYVATILAGFMAYGCSVTLFPSLIDASLASSLQEAGKGIAPIFTIKIPPIMEVMTALVFSFMAGLGIASSKSTALKNGFNEFKEIITKAISNVIIPLLPIFIFGLFLDMSASRKVSCSQHSSRSSA